MPRNDYHITSWIRGISIFQIYFQALVQGIGFTTIPAAANFLTSEQGFGFSVEQYGSLFIPMIFGAILSAFFGGLLAQRFTIKNVYLAAGLLNVIAMLLITCGQWRLHDSSFTFPLLLTAMAFLGAGFGANITTLNPYAVHYFPAHASAALTALHSFLGIGTALGPLAFNFFFSRSHWWGDPLSIAGLYLILLLLAAGFLPREAPLDIQETAGEKKTAHNLLWIFALIALLYGVTETSFGNWATIFLHQEKGLSETSANNALSVFWGSVTIGRILATFLSLRISPRMIYRSLPIFILIGIASIGFIHSVSFSLIAFGIAGLGCSAYLPLTVSFGVQSYLESPSFASGLLISTYMVGYGLAAEGIGVLMKTTGTSLGMIYALLSIVVLVLALLCLVATRKKLV